jgi:hypothetical protein
MAFIVNEGTAENKQAMIDFPGIGISTSIKRPARPEKRASRQYSQF